MKIFLLGDFESNTGPGNANKQIMQALSLKYKVEYSIMAGKIQRIFEVYQKIKQNDILLICSASRINYLAVKIAQNTKKKIIYLMHGYSSYEYKIEGYKEENKIVQEAICYEKFIFDNVDCIVCVSKRCMDFMKEQLPQYANKMNYIYNIIDVKDLERLSKSESQKTKSIQILSVGGGMRRKNILPVAQAISNMDIKINFVVVGKTLIDGEKIKKFNCVTWYEYLEHAELYRIMQQSDIYIQNSSFETFCLAVIEALYAGCSVLLSNSIGCLDLFENVTPTDVIFDINNQDEISRKIKYLISNPNQHRLLKGLKTECITTNAQANKWEEIICNITQI